MNNIQSSKRQISKSYKSNKSNKSNKPLKSNKERKENIALRDKIEHRLVKTENKENFHYNYDLSSTNHGDNKSNNHDLTKKYKENPIDYSISSLKNEVFNNNNNYLYSYQNTSQTQIENQFSSKNHKNHNQILCFSSINSNKNEKTQKTQKTETNNSVFPPQIDPILNKISFTMNNSLTDPILSIFRSSPILYNSFINRVFEIVNKEIESEQVKLISNLQSKIDSLQKEAKIKEEEVGFLLKNEINIKESLNLSQSELTMLRNEYKSVVFENEQLKKANLKLISLNDSLSNENIVKLDIIKGNNNEISNLNEKLTVNHKEKSELLEKLSEMNDCCMKLVTENEENVIEISRIKEKNRVIRNKLHEKVEYIQRLEGSISKNYPLERGLF